MTARTAHGARYGGHHPTARRMALEALRANPATPCVRCGGPMNPDQLSLLHLDHVDGSDEYAGLSHDYCKLSRRRAPRPEPAPRGACRADPGEASGPPWG